MQDPNTQQPQPAQSPAPAPDKAAPPPERKAPGFPGEARPGSVPPPRDGVDPVTGEITPTAPPRKPISQFLIEQRNGALHAELSDALADVVKAVQDHHKAGAVSLTITVKPGAKGTATLVVTDDVKVKAPRGERPAAMFFADADGNLSRNDPRQTELPLRRVEVGQGADLRRAGGDA